MENLKDFGNANMEGKRNLAKIIIPRKGNKEKNAEILKALNEISDDDISKLGKVLESMGMSSENVGKDSKNTIYTKLNGISDLSKNQMKLLLNTLIMDNKLRITSDKKGRCIDLDILNYKIKVLDLGYYYRQINKNIKVKNHYSESLDIRTWETDRDGMKIVSEDRNVCRGRKVADETDIKDILKTLTKEYSYIKPGQDGDEHDKDIAFFMLMTQCLGEFLLKNDKVLKCYYDFRGFRNLRDGGTGQIILVKPKSDVLYT